MNPHESFSTTANKENKTMLNSNEVIANIFPDNKSSTYNTTIGGELRSWQQKEDQSPVDELNLNMMNLNDKASQQEGFMHPVGGQNNFNSTAVENQFVLEASFCAVSDTILGQLQGGQDQWMTMQLHDKMLQFASMLSNMRKDLRLGGLVGMYQLLRGENGEISEEILNVIIEEIFTAIADYEAQEQIFLIAALEVIGFIGPNERSYQRIQIIRQLICEPSLQPIQINCLCCLLQLGYEGLRTVVELATKDYNKLQPFILCNLLQVRAIQRVILVPSILSQLNSTTGNSMTKIQNLAMLNRLGQLVWEAGGLPILVNFIEEGNIDRQLIASVLRTSGKEGEGILLKLLKFHKNERVRMAAASVLSYRLPEDPHQIELELLLESSDLTNERMSSFIPGQVCRYIGPVTSLILEEHDKSEQEIMFSQDPVMEVNQRDFLASLHRMLSLNNEYFIHQFDSDNERQDVGKRLLTPGIESTRRGGILANFSLKNVQVGLTQDPALVYENFNDIFNEDSFVMPIGQRVSISDQVIKSLNHHLIKEESAQVKEVIAAAMGGIGLPEGQACLDSLIKYLKKSGQTKTNKNVEEPAVRSMAVWSIGRLASIKTIQKGSQMLLQALNDPYFKVRASACTALAQFGISECALSNDFDRLSNQAIPILVKLLKDGQLNKQSVAETIVLMGPHGEQTLVNVLAKEPDTNTNLKSCMVRALALSNVSNASIDFAIEMLFKTARDKNPQIRKASIVSIDILRKKSISLSDQVTYLKAKNLLPFLYKSLMDKDKSVRNSALLAITNFGPQGELMFIEGVTKESNAQIRIECAKGLGKIGPTTFRTLLLTLHDQHPIVKEAASQAILRNMTPSSVQIAFAEKSHQRQSLICSISEVLASQEAIHLSNEIISFLQELSQLFLDGTE